MLWGILLQMMSSFTEEASEAIAKENVQKKREDVWTFGFLNALVPLIGYLVYVACIAGWSVVHVAVWWTFLLRVVLVTIQSVTTVLAIVRAERSTFSFLRVGSIPLVLMIDLWLGVYITGWQALGMMTIAGTLLFLSLNHGLSTKGIGFVIFGSISAAVQVSLFRYSVTHGNSVEAEQMAVLACIAILFFLLGLRNPHSMKRSLREPRVILQSCLHGAATMVSGYAFLFAPASILLTTGRATGVAGSIWIGKRYFHEKHFVVKLLGFIGCVIGICLLAFGG